MHKTKQIIILISLFVVFSALNISNTATTNACWGWRNHKPKLTDGQVNPSQGDQMTLFTYTVNYIDADNDEPIIILVVINCRPYCMHKQDPSDNDYTDGCIYTYSRYLQPGYYDFWFIGTDGYRIVWTPRMYGPTVIGTTPPILSNGQVDPSTGERGLTEFNFSVIYTDAENNPPTFLDITLDGADFTMIKTDPLDCDYTDGCGYYYATSLDVLGTHQFNFSASDGCYCVHSETFLDPTVVDTIAPDLTCSSPLNTTYTSGTIDIIVSSSAIDVDMFWYALYDITNEQWIGYQNGTVITGGHATVDLGSSYYLINVYVNDTAGNINSTEIYFTIANPPVLSAGQVDPSIGEKWLTEFNFSVIYTDEDNSPPIIMNITLDGINYTMDKVNPLDCNYVDGCTYNYITILEELGEHQFKFYTFDDTYWVYSDIFIGPTVQDTIGPDLTCSSPLNTTYTSGTIDIIVSSNAIDVDLFWYTLYDVFNEQWIGYQNGTVITGGHATVDLGSGYYLMNVYVNDTFGNLNSTEIYFTIANPPILSDGQVDPLIGERYFTLFNFSVIYTDEDNSPPTVMNITLDGVNYTMIKADPLDSNYMDGCTYYYETTLEELGMHQFIIYTSDGIYWTFSDLICGPFIQDTIPPDLVCSSPLNTTYTSGTIDIIVSSSATDVDLFWYTLYDVFNEQWIGYQNGTVITGGHATVDLGSGYYLMNVYVNDTVGNLNSIEIYFTIANPPILSDGQIDPLIGERWLTLFNFSINYSDIDNSPPTIMNITLDGVNYTMIKAIIDDNNYLDGCIYYFATTIEELGEHQFNFCTSDGTYWTYSETFFYPTVQDTTPPDIICSSPMNITYNSGIIDIIVSSSAIDVDLFWYTLYDVYNEQWIGYQNGTVITEGQVTPDLGESYYKIDIYVNDTVGNINTITIYFTVLLYIIVDTIPPDLVCSSPINKTYNAGNIDILVSSSALDVDSFWYTLYCVSCDDWIGDPKGILIESGSASLNLEDGYYIITVFVNDTFGNTNSEEICFTVSIPMMPMFPPELIMIIIGSTLGAGALGTVIIVKRRKSKAQKYHYDKIFDKEKGGMVIFKDKVTKPRKESEVKLEGYKAPPLPPPVKDLLKKELKETNQLKGDSKTVSDKPAD